MEAPPPKRRSRRLAAAVIVLVVAFAVAALEAFPTSTYSFREPSAVTYALSVNATSIYQNQVLEVTMSDTNYLPFPNGPSVNFLFPNSLNLSSGFCGLEYPFGLAAFQGHYTLANLSASSEVDIFPPGVFFCPLSLGPLRLGPFQSVTRTADLSGYWSAGETPAPGGGSTQGVLHRFQPGSYTLVTEDAWGHVRLAYFQMQVYLPPGS